MRLKRAVPVKKAAFAVREAAEPLDPAEKKKLKVEQKKNMVADAAAAKVKLSSAVNLLTPHTVQPTAATASSEKGKKGKGKGASQGKSDGKKSDDAEDGETAVEEKKGAVMVTAEALMPFHSVIRTSMSLQKFVEPTEVRLSDSFSFSFALCDT